MNTRMDACRRIFINCTYAAALLILLVPAPVIAQPAEVLTQHNDNERTGANLNEAQLTVPTVSSGSFGLLYSLPVDGQIYAQPLYVPKADFVTPFHNVLYVATMQNNVYAFDADDPHGLVLWQRHLGTPVLKNFMPMASAIATLDRNELIKIFKGEFTNQNFCAPEPPSCAQKKFNIEPAIGITSTPVIDRSSSTIYVMAKTQELQTNGEANYAYALHALDLMTGDERPGSPAVVDSNNVAVGTLRFDPKMHLQRPGLLLANGVVYVAFGAHQDTPPYHGWILGFDARTLQLKASFSTTPNGEEGGIWQSGNGLAADAENNIYAMTGNGSFDSGKQNFGDSFIKLDPNLNVIDFFTPGDFQDMDTADADLGSAGPLLLPTHLLVGGGKKGVFYVLDQQHMGRHVEDAQHRPLQKFQATQSADPGVTAAVVAILTSAGLPKQALQAASTNVCGLDYHHIHGSPVIWKQSRDQALVYVWGERDKLRAFKFIADMRGFMDTSHSPDDYCQTMPAFCSTMKDPDSSNPGKKFMPGGSLSVSANGSMPSTGIVWASVPVHDDAVAQLAGGALHAFDAADLKHELWCGGVGTFAKFVAPTVANGKVYLATFDQRVNVYGLGAHQDEAHSGNLGGYHTLSSPFVSGDYVYFQGEHDALYKVNINNPNGDNTNLGGYHTLSSPFVSGDYVYFRGEHDALYKVNINNPNGDNTNLGGYHTLSSPFVSGDYVYFQGEHDALYKVNINNPNGDNTNLGGYHTLSSPFVSGDYVYFQGEHNKLYKVNINNPNGDNTNLGGWELNSTPFVSNDYVYFQGTDDTLWRAYKDGGRGTIPGCYNKTKSSPFVAGDRVYFEGTDDQLLTAFE
jgi:hypothetical protein